MSYANHADFLANAEAGETFTEQDGRTITTLDLVSAERVSETERRVIVNRTRTTHVPERKQIESHWLEKLSMTVTVTDDGWASVAFTIRFDWVDLGVVPVTRYSRRARDEAHAAALMKRPQVATA